MNAAHDRPRETPQQWLRYAEGDLTVAEREMHAPAPVYHVVCFLCQGAAEKFLKAYLIAQGWSLEKTHDLVTLLGRCAGYDAGFATLAAEGALLNEYILAGRYPGDIAWDQITAADAAEALEAAQRIRGRVQQALGATRQE